MSKRIAAVMTCILLSLLLSVSVFAATNEKEAEYEAEGYIPLTQEDISNATTTKSDKGIYIGDYYDTGDKMVLEGAKYYLAEDITFDKKYIYWDGPKTLTDIALELNGHKFTTSNESRFSVQGRYIDENYEFKLYRSITIRDSKKNGIMTVGDGSNVWYFGVQASGNCKVVVKDINVKGKFEIINDGKFPYSEITEIESCRFENRSGNRKLEGGFVCGGSAMVSQSTFVNAASFGGKYGSESNTLEIRKGCVFGNEELTKDASSSTGPIYAEKYDVITVGEEEGKDSDVQIISGGSIGEGQYVGMFFLKAKKVVLNHFTSGNSKIITGGRVLLLNADPENISDSIVFRSGTVYAPYKAGMNSYGDETSMYALTFQFLDVNFSESQLKSIRDSIFKKYTGTVSVLGKSNQIICTSKKKGKAFVMGTASGGSDDPDTPPGDQSDTVALRNCKFEWNIDVSKIYYDGNEKKIGFALTKPDGTQLEEGADYNVTYTDPKEHSEDALVKNVGKVKVKITPVEDRGLTGTLTKYYIIKPMVLADAAIDGVVTSSIDSSSEIIFSNIPSDNKPEPEIRLGDLILVKGKDYTLSYKNFAKAAAANSSKAPSIKVKGKGNFKGNWIINYNIVPQTLSANSIVVSAKDVAQTTKKGKWLSKVSIKYNDKTVKLKSSAFEVSYKTASGNEITKETPVEAGTTVVVTVKAKDGGNFCDEVETTYRVTEKLITKAKVSLNDGVNLVYDETEVAAEMVEVIPAKNAPALNPGTEYVIKSYEYKTIKNKKYALITIKGVGTYGGEKLLKVRL